MADDEVTVPLSKRELQVLEMVATGASNQEIAHQLVISVNTVKVHLRNIFEKLDVQSRTEATLRAVQEGWVVIGDEAAAVEEPPTPNKTYLLNLKAQPALVPWQQYYLILAILLALAVMIIPFIPKSLPKSSPNLPVIYAQPTPPVPPSSSTWVFQTPMPTKRAGLGLAAFERRIFAIGGVRDNNQATRTVEIYDPLTDSWTEGASKPTATANIVAVILDDKIYVPGGCTNEGQAIDSLEIYDPKTDSWQQGEALPEARCGYGLTAFQDKLYLFGGWNGKNFEDTVFVFSPQEDTWEVMASPMPQAKGYVGAATLNDTIYVVGGYDGKHEFDHTHVFEPETGQWLEKSPLQEKRGGLGLISAANSLYAVGGGWQKTLTSSEEYNSETDTWAPIETAFSHQWRNMGLATVDTKIYAVGGWDGTDEQYMDSVVSYQFLFQLFLPFSVGDEE